MDFHTATDFLKQYWVWITFLTFVWHTWAKTKAKVTKWAGTLLNNHAHHMQASLASIEVTQKKQLELLKQIADKL